VTLHASSIGETAGGVTAQRLRGIVGWAQRNGLFFALILIVAFFATRSDRYLTVANLHVVLLQVAVVGIIAVPGAMLLMAGYVDLAVGSIAVLASVVFGELAAAGSKTVLAAAIALLVGLGWGLATGYLVAYLGFSPVVVTLGGLAGARGVAEILSKGFTKYGFGTGFAELGNGEFLGIDTPVWIFSAVFLLGSYAWYQSPLGRHVTAVGSDRVAAHSLGVATKRIPFLLYGASGLAAALGGLIVTSQLDASSLSIGINLELSVLSAILLGGVSFLGGRGSLFGVLLGVLFIGALDNGLVQMNVGPYFQRAAVGLALILAAALDVLYQRLDRIPVPDVPEPARAVAGEGRAA
jgi:ribose/xylose/arabinose/galactoside ABC-type transport system permease subunit